jgi:hypothetical protein
MMMSAKIVILLAIALSVANLIIGIVNHNLSAICGWLVAIMLGIDHVRLLRGIDKIEKYLENLKAELTNDRP